MHIHVRNYKREGDSYIVWNGENEKKNNQQVLRHHHQTDRVKKKWEKKRGKMIECKREREMALAILFTKRIVEMGALLFT